MHEIGATLAKLKGKDPLLPSVTHNATKGDEGAHHAVEVRSRCYIEIGAAFVHEHDVVVLSVFLRESVDERRRVRLRAAHYARYQIQEIQRN